MQRKYPLLALICKSCVLTSRENLQMLSFPMHMLILCFILCISHCNNKDSFSVSDCLKNLFKLIQVIYSVSFIIVHN